MAGLVAADGVTPLAVAVRDQQRRASAGQTAYQAADPTSQELASWHPYKGSADGDLLAERDIIDPRARDISRNNGWINGYRLRQTDKIIGAGLRLSCKPDYRALGLSPEWAHEWGEQVEAGYREWAEDPGCYADLGRRLDAGGLQAQGYGHYMHEGDAVAVLHWRDRPGTRFRTCLQVVDPDRLTNPNDLPDTETMRRGIELNSDTAPIAYHFRKSHPGDQWYGANTYQWERVERETPWGRPMVVHFADFHTRSGLSRGVSMLASVLGRIKSLDKYEAVELQAAILNAILCAFIESPFDHTTLAETLDDGKIGKYQDLRKSFHDNRNLTLGGVKIPTLFPGERIGFQTASRPNTAFDAFETAVLRGTAAGLGTSMEELTQAWSQTTYTSARAALMESWTTLLARRRRFARGFWTPIYGAVLEDMIDLGMVDMPRNAPAFQDARAAYMRGRWIGPGRGWVDPVKEKQGAVMGMSAGLSTLEDENAEQGRDWREVLDQIRIEMKSMPEGFLHPALYEFNKLVNGGGDAPELPAQAPGGHR